MAQTTSFIMIIKNNYIAHAHTYAGIQNTHKKEREKEEERI